MLLTTPSFVQAVVISYESMTFSEVMKLPSTQRIAVMRIREKIKKKIEESIPK